MPRDGEKVRRALRAAAVELFTERGFDATTSADIATRAGVTERTFFRHFPDKRDVLFDGEQTLLDVMVEGMDGAAGAEAPLALVRRGLLAAVPLVEANLPIAAPRAAIIRQTPALMERALAKEAWLNAALTDALVQRGADQPMARLAVEIAMAGFGRAAQEWFTDPSEPLAVRVDRAFADLRTLTGAL